MAIESSPPSIEGRVFRKVLDLISSGDYLSEGQVPDQVFAKLYITGRAHGFLKMSTLDRRGLSGTCNMVVDGEPRKFLDLWN